MNVSVLVCTHGEASWQQLALERAVPSAEAAHPYETLVFHQPAWTLAQVRNYAAAVAHGDWLCFLDADDELDPGYLDAMCAVRTADPRSRPQLLAPSVSYISGGRASAPFIPNFGRWPALNECVIGTLVPRDLFLEVGGFREFAAYEDWDLALRCHKAGAELVHVPDAVYRAHVREGSRNEIARTDTYQQIWSDYTAE